MPKGKGTYGSQVGRPSQSSKKEYMGGGMTDEYQYGGMPTNDARNRMQNTPGDGMTPSAPVPAMAPKIENPVDMGNQENNMDTTDMMGQMKKGGKIEYKKGGKVTKAEKQKQAYNKKLAKTLKEEGENVFTGPGSRMYEKSTDDEKMGYHRQSLKEKKEMSKKTIKRVSKRRAEKALSRPEKIAEAKAANKENIKKIPFNEKKVPKKYDVTDIVKGQAKLLDRENKKIKKAKQAIRDAKKTIKESKKK